MFLCSIFERDKIQRIKIIKKIFKLINKAIVY